MAEGVCTPGTLKTGSGCGTCGISERTCGLMCTWGSWTCNEPADCVYGLCDVSCTEMGHCGAMSHSACMTLCQPDLGDCTPSEFGDYAACNTLLPGVACSTWFN